MAIASASAWQESLETDLPNVANDDWKANLALFLDDQVSGKLQLTGIFASPGTAAGVFTFASAAFKDALSGNTPAVLSNAFETAIGSSTMIVAPGAFVGNDPSNLASKFSLVASAVIDPASIALAKLEVLKLATIPLTDDPLESQFAVFMRAAFLKLTVTVSGTNSVAPTPGPLSFPTGAVQ